MTHWLLALFRAAVLIRVLAWAVEAGDLAQHARGYVETTVAGWNLPTGR